jgi:hypothetical protein
VVEKDPRVAQVTPTEERLIALCRAAHSNERIKSCALFCKLIGEDGPRSWFSIDAIRVCFLASGETRAPAAGAAQELGH